MNARRGRHVVVTFCARWNGPCATVNAVSVAAAAPATTPNDDHNNQNKHTDGCHDRGEFGFEQRHSKNCDECLWAFMCCEQSSGARDILLHCGSYLLSEGFGRCWHCSGDSTRHCGAKAGVINSQLAELTDKHLRLFWS